MRNQFPCIKFIESYNYDVTVTIIVQIFGHNKVKEGVTSDIHVTLMKPLHSVISPQNIGEKS